MRPARTGPRPLALHLAAAGAISTSSLTAWTLLRSGWTPWSESQAAAGSALQRDLENLNPDAFAGAVLRELQRRHARYLTGLEVYRSHPYRRTLTAPPPLWESGPAQLLDFGASHPAGENGPPVLVVPSLINRSDIVDLKPGCSLMRYLAERGFRPLLLDWGRPGEAELERSLDDYIGGDLSDALAVANEVASGRPVPVVGYCMGGTMSVALAALQGERISRLALLAAPWDFHAGTGGPPPFATAGAAALDGLISAMGCLPVDALQALFFALDPVLGWNKFRDFADMAPESNAAETFVALEDWLNDGVPLAAPVARECLFGWYGGNGPAAGDWKVCGTTIDPAAIAAPALVVIPSQDRIVPPASAAALADRLPAAEKRVLNAGHIGMIVGRRAQTALWSPLADWLHDTKGSRRVRKTDQ